MNRISTVVAVTTLAASLAACSGDDSSSEAAGSEVTILVPGASCLGLYPLQTGIAEGYYEEEGIDLRVQVAEKSSGIVQALVSDRGDVGLPAPQSVIGAQESGEQVTFFANVYAGGAFRVIAPAESGVTGLEDLRGKTIGVEAADGGEAAYLNAVMADVGLTPGEDFEVLSVGEGGPAVAAFNRGDIDAYAAANGPAATIAAAGVETVTVSPPPSPSDFSNGLAATDEWLDKNTDTAVGLARAFRRAAELGAEDPDAVIEACREVSPQEVEDETFAKALIAAAANSMTPIDGDQWGSWRPEGIETMIADTEASLDLEPGSVDAKAVFNTELVDEFNQ